MRLVEIIKNIRDSRLKIFSLSDLKKLLAIGKDNTAYKIAEKLVAENILQRLKKGVYASTFYPPESFETANALYFPSYISLESALNYYGILSQFPYTITSVTPKKSKKLTINDAEYEYTQLAKHLFRNFKKESGVVIATPEKALIDMIYLVAKGFRRISFEELDYSIINKNEFKSLCTGIEYPIFQKQLKKIKI